jgi:hypothetical protein
MNSHNDLAALIATLHTTSTVAQPAPRLMLCCGERPVGRKDQPLVLSCQLCPRSSTYWRRGEVRPL